MLAACGTAVDGQIYPQTLRGGGVDGRGGRWQRGAVVVVSQAWQSCSALPSCCCSCGTTTGPAGAGSSGSRATAAGDWKDAHPDAIPSSPGDLDGSADVSRRVSVDVMRKPERHSLALTCGTDYDGFAHPERRVSVVMQLHRRKWGLGRRGTWHRRNAVLGHFTARSLLVHDTRTAPPLFCRRNLVKSRINRTRP